MISGKYVAIVTNGAARTSRIGRERRHDAGDSHGAAIGAATEEGPGPGLHRIGSATGERPAAHRAAARAVRRYPLGTVSANAGRSASLS